MTSPKQRLEEFILKQPIDREFTRKELFNSLNDPMAFNSFQSYFSQLRKEGVVFSSNPGVWQRSGEQISSKVEGRLSGLLLQSITKSQKPWYKRIFS